MKSAIKRNFVKFTGRLGFNRSPTSNNVPDEPEIVGPDLPKENVPSEPVEFESEEFEHRIRQFKSFLVSLSDPSIDDDNKSKHQPSLSNSTSNSNIANSINNNNHINNNSSFNISNIYLPNDLIHAIFCTLISNSNMLINTSSTSSLRTSHRHTQHQEKQSNCSILSKIIPIMCGLSCAYISCTSSTTPEELVQQLFLQTPSEHVTIASLNAKSTAHKRINIQHSANSGTNSNNSSANYLEHSLLTKSVETPPNSRSRNNSIASTSSQSPSARQRMENYKMVDILLVDDIDIAPMSTRYTLLQMMTYRKVAFKGATYNTPSSLSIIATASYASNQQSANTFSSVEPLSPLMLDCFFITMRLYEPLRLPPFKVDWDPLLSTVESHFIVTPSRLINLRQLISKIYITHDIEQYMRTIIVNLRNHPLVKFGPSPRATPTLTLAAKIVAILSGQKFVTPTHILMIATQVLNHRVFISNPFPLDHTHPHQHSPSSDDEHNSPYGSPNTNINLHNTTSSLSHPPSHINDPFSASSNIPVSIKMQKPGLSILSQAGLLPPPPISIVDTNTELNIKSSVELHQVKSIERSTNQSGYDSSNVIKIILENLTPPL